MDLFTNIIVGFLSVLFFVISHNWMYCVTKQQAKFQPQCLELKRLSDRYDQL